MPSEKLNTKQSLFGKPTIYHALVVIFLEFFSLGLLATPIISVLYKTFPKHTFLINGTIQGIKGLLSFLSAPLIGALSDVFGRKIFLILTVSWTCLPVIFLPISPVLYFVIVTLSGVFSVTFSIIFAYVADITADEQRSWAYGLVSASFAASFIISPAIGAYISNFFGLNYVIALSSIIAVLDLLFIIFFLPETLTVNWHVFGSLDKRISWQKINPFESLKRISKDQLILVLCVTTFLSYLPEAGEYSCFFIYFVLLMKFSEEHVAFYIAMIGIVSCFAQTFLLIKLIRMIGPKWTIIVGLLFEATQLALYGFSSNFYLIWLAGVFAAIGSLTYPSISTFVSNHADQNEQGASQGVLTGIRGLCNGLGPALFGFLFYLFEVDFNKLHEQIVVNSHVDAKSNHSALKIFDTNNSNNTTNHISPLMPGPPFAFGCILVIVAIVVSFLIPDSPKSSLQLITYHAVPTYPKSVSHSRNSTSASSDEELDEDELLSDKKNSTNSNMILQEDSSSIMFHSLQIKSPESQFSQLSQNEQPEESEKISFSKITPSNSRANQNRTRSSATTKINRVNKPSLQKFSNYFVKWRRFPLNMEYKRNRTERSPTCDSESCIMNQDFSNSISLETNSIQNRKDIKDLNKESERIVIG